MKYILLLLVCFCLNVHSREFTEDEKNMFVASQVLIVADWMQTRDIVRQPDIYWENNSVLGRHPSMGEVNKYFIASLVGNYYFTNYLDKNRMLWLQIHTVTRGATVANNARIGLTMRF